MRLRSYVNGLNNAVAHGYAAGQDPAISEGDNPYKRAEHRTCWLEGFHKGRAAIIVIDGRAYERFIQYPRDINDGTLRCISCGQIDEEEYHDDRHCPMIQAIETTGQVAA